MTGAVRNLATSALTAQVDTAQAAWQARREHTRRRELLARITVTVITAIALAVMGAGAGVCYAFGAWWWAAGLMVGCVLLTTLGIGVQR